MLRRRALARDRKLEEILKLAIFLTLSETQASTIENDQNTVRQISNRRVDAYATKVKHKPGNKQGVKTRQCYYCGGAYLHEEECPAMRETCDNCGKHFH